MLIDCHTHVFPDKLAAKAGASLSATAGFPHFSDLTVDGQLKVMEEDGVDQAIVLNTVTNTRQVENVNLFAISVAKRFAVSGENALQKMIPFGSVHPLGEHTAETVKALHGQGITGLKLHPDYLGIAFDDPSYDPILQTASELGMPVVIHAGFDPVSPDFVHASPKHILHVLEKFPNLKLVCAHLGGMLHWDEVEELLCGKDLWMDTAFISERTGMNRDTALRVIRKHGADRILFGSDLPWARPSEIKAFLESLPLTAEEKECIYYKNAQKLFNLR